ncbi:3-oxoacyl-[acyl-carrier-protein] synthase-3 [Glaciihabitans tibetensis]|uniref:3-oxoacyl-[acyl-carrier-protein] synthase-3 n=1 Tax=Glaciihabitans tibetensis TaxID=1266600 RepID=A0A2T0VFP3_9MICO|nr:ketoacyl-ACP synthase III [Glaciihabitans tibetensis]PRY69037.1 3-oxoacyl-[acyl-carrier-protein] synthase-3 [Glaciihabitans tibetensis]
MVLMQDSPPTTPIATVRLPVVGSLAVAAGPGGSSLAERISAPAVGTGATILGLGSYVPTRVVTNEEVGTPAGVTAEWIEGKTAIRERRWAGDDQATSDLAIRAGARAIADAGIRADQLRLIVVATSTPDQSQPPTAAYVQRALGADNAAVFDLNAVCSGFVFALGVVTQMVAATGGLALVIGADVYSRILNRQDRRTAILFGDGAGAAVVGHSSKCEGHRLIATGMHSFGDLTDIIGVPAGGSRLPIGPDVSEELRYFGMDGRAVRTFVAENMPDMILSFLAKNGLSLSDIHHFIPHQANGMMLRDLVSALEMPAVATHLTLEHYGNTGAASIPITLDAAYAAGRVKKGEIVLLAGFGGGMSVGMTLLRW